MAIINRIGGGGGGLAFKVKAFTELPAIGNENDIAVITDTPMTGWVMQAEQPTGAEGLVWIKLGTAATVPVWVDKKEQIKIYPAAAKQYVNGAWSGKTAKTYQNGAWRDWILLLYSYGSWLTTFTPTGFNLFTPTENADNVYIVANNLYDKSCRWRADMLIDFASFNTVSITHQTTNDNYFFPVLQVVNSSGTVLAKQNLTVNGVKETINLDISSINESGYVQIGARYPTSYTGTARFNMTLYELKVDI